MIKKIIMIVLIGLSINTNAQTEKISVGILPFTYVSSSANYENVNSIQEVVTNSFVKTKRFNIVDRSKMDALKKEKELQKTEDFMDGAVVAQGKSLGAQYLISGHIVSAQAEEMRADDGKGNIEITYKAKLVISLKIIDIETGQVTTSETIEPKAGSTLLGMIGMGSSSPQAAIEKAMKSIQEKIDSFVNNNFPVVFSVVEIQEKDGSGAAKKILIAGGSDFGLSKGNKMKIVEIVDMTVGGKKIKRKKEIGEIKIVKVEDENFSICEVRSGGVDIATKFDAKANIQAVSITQ
jgi:curli biogenesis system outer membrane secretion channel CsgG